jgi:hypothetical protein
MLSFQILLHYESKNYLEYIENDNKQDSNNW